MTNEHKRRCHADSGIIVEICDLKRLESPKPTLFAMQT